MNFKLQKYHGITIIMLMAAFQAMALQEQQDSSRVIFLSLTQAWERAEMGNREIQIKQLGLEAQAERIKEAKISRLPEILADGQYARVSKLPVYKNGLFSTPEQLPVLPAYYKVGASVYLNLYNGNKNILAIKSSQTDFKIAAENKELTLSQVKLQSAAYLLDIQRSLIFQDFLLKDIAAQQKQLLQIETLQKNGLVLKSDVLKSELKLSRQRLALLQLDNDLAIASQKLSILIGLSGEQQIKPLNLEGIDSVYLRPFDDYLIYALGNAYQLKISEHETELVDLKLKEVIANISPQIGLFANYAYSYPQIFLYPYTASIYGFGMAGIKASFAISSIYLNSHKVKFAKLSSKSQQVEHEQATDNIRQQVYEAYLRCKVATERIEVNKKSVRQAAENRRIVSNSYFNQFALITDLLDADTELLQTHFDLAATKIAARFQYYHLLHIIGQL